MVQISVDERFLQVYKAYGVSLDNPLVGIETLTGSSVYSLANDNKPQVDWIEIKDYK